MSSAQEAVTGSAKLDMAGVMAALALARQEEAEAGVRGQKSFLHNNYNKSSSGLLVRAEPLQTEVEEPGKTAGSGGGRRKENTGAGAGAGGVTNIVKSYESSPGNCGAKTSSSTNQKVEVATASIRLSSPRPVESPVEPSGRKKVSECRAAFENLTSPGFSSSSSSLESSPRQDKKSSGSVWRLSQAHCESGSRQTTEKQPDNNTERITEKHSNTVTPVTTANIENSGLVNLPVKDNMVNMPDMGNMAGFLSVVEKLSEEKEKQTGNGRLDMSELVSALNNFQSTSKAPAVAAAATPRSPPPLPAKPPPRSAGSPSCPPCPPPPPSLSPSSGSGGQPGHFQTTNRTKSSFLQSQLKQNTEQQQDAASSSNTKPSYAEEKNSLLGELKSKLNKENSGSVSGDGKPSVPRRKLEVSNPSQDQIVNKIVYNQYRDMLNSYRNNK